MSDSYQNSVLHAGTQAGLFRFPVNGLSWQPARSGLSDVPVLSLISDAPNAVLFAGAGNGVYFSIDGGENWQATRGDFDVRTLALDPKINMLYAATGPLVYRSSDGGARWEAVGAGLPESRVLVLILVPGGVLYAGTEVGVYQLDAAADRWRLIGGGLSGRQVRALLFDRQTSTLYAGTQEGVFRLADRGTSWQEIGQGLPGTGVSSLALDAKGVELYVGLERGGVFRSINQGLDWQPAGKGLPDNNVLSLAIASASGALYAGTEGQGVYCLPDDGGYWQPVADGLSRMTVFTLVLTDYEQPWPVSGEIMSGGLYWQERYPAERRRLETSREALVALRLGHDEAETKTGKTYPWRLGIFPSTGLPALLRTFLPHALAGDEVTVSPRILDLLTATQAQAVFGLRDEEQKMLEQELEPGPIITFRSGETHPQAQLSHFVWRQVFKGYPVIGGGVRVHGVHADERIAVTSSYFPIPDDYNFAPDPTTGEDPLAPRLTLEQARQRALEAILRAKSVEDMRPFWAALVEQSLARQDHETLVQALISLQQHMTGGLGRWLILLVVALLRQGTRLRRLGLLALRLIGPLLGTEAQAAHFECVPIEGRELAIMPFAGAYHLVSRMRIRMPKGSPWHLDVDMKTGQVPGHPWQTAIYAPNFYRTSGEAMPGGGPMGAANNINMVELQKYIAGLPATTQELVNQSGTELTNVAAHAQRLHDHLVTACGVPTARLEGYRQNGVLQKPGLSVEVNSNSPTGFDYAEDLSRKIIRFQQDNGSGIPIGSQFVYAPALDPEVVMHEFTHGFLWLINSAPWDVPPTPDPFGRALQEGYAMYLARSLAAQEPGEEQQIWARAAYSSRKRADNSPNWADRWAFGRSKSVLGADLLPAPNVYPSGSYSLKTPEGYDLAYDVGMVWARSLWDLRRLVGWQQADLLAVQAYPYLHGYIANFELAAEGLLDADLKLAGNVNLANGSQPIWAIRGIVAGQGVYGFAQAANGTLIAASDVGILASIDQGNSWSQEQNNFAGGSLTGIVAVAAEGNTLYAAVQMPVFDTAGNHTQWEPNIFSKNLPGAVWQAPGDWPADTQEATPLSLLVGPNGELWVGTSQGVYHLVGGRWLPVGDLADANNAFAALGSVVILQGTLTLIRACTPDNLRQISAAPLQGRWSLPGTGVFDGTLVRPTGIVEWSHDAYVGTLEKGLWKINPDFTTTQVLNTSDAILALAARGTQLYLATEKDILFSGGGTNFASRVLPHPDAKVISMFVTASNHLLAGTLAHGIWRHDGNNWLPVYTPPRPSQIILNAGEHALLSFVLPQANAVAYRINTPNVVQVQEVAKPGFPLQRIPRNADGRYTLPHGPIILSLENMGNARITLNVQVQTANQVIDIR